MTDHATIDVGMPHLRHGLHLLAVIALPFLLLGLDCLMTYYMLDRP
jgi:hypothetical protein